MKVLKATTRGQGKRSSDFCHALPGELVMFTFECDGEKVDGACGCRRSMGGVGSHKGTTTFEVVDEPGFTRAMLVETVRASLGASGWLAGGDRAENDKWIGGMADDLVRCAEAFPHGSLLERRGKVMQVRTLNPKIKLGRIAPVR